MAGTVPTPHGSFNRQMASGRAGRRIRRPGRSGRRDRERRRRTAPVHVMTTLSGTGAWRCRAGRSVCNPSSPPMKPTRREPTHVGSIRSSFPDDVDSRPGDPFMVRDAGGVASRRTRVTKVTASAWSPRRTDANAATASDDSPHRTPLSRRPCSTARRTARAIPSPAPPGTPARARSPAEPTDHGPGVLRGVGHGVTAVPASHRQRAPAVIGEDANGDTVALTQSPSVDRFPARGRAAITNGCHL